MTVTVRTRQTSVAFAVGRQQTLLKGEPLELHVYNRVRPAALGLQTMEHSFVIFAWAIVVRFAEGRGEKPCLASFGCSASDLMI